MKNLTKNDTAIISCGGVNCACLLPRGAMESRLRSGCGSYCCVLRHSKSYSFSFIASISGEYYTLTESCDEFMAFMRAVDFVE